MKHIVTLILIMFAGSAYATEVSWMYVQHRVYENGRTYNRLAFGLADENGNDLSGAQNVESLKLSDPRGHLVKLSECKFSRDEEIYQYLKHTIYGKQIQDSRDITCA